MQPAPTVRIRDGRSDDEPAFNELSRMAFEELRHIYRPSPAAVADKSVLDLFRIVAVDARDDILGTVQYRIEPPRLHLMGLAVHRDHRKKGVARRLVDRLAEIACARDLAIVSLYTVRETGNASLFERLGFRTVREQADGWFIGVDGRPVTEVYMERPT